MLPEQRLPGLDPCQVHTRWELTGCFEERGCHREDLPRRCGVVRIHPGKELSDPGFFAIRKDAGEGLIGMGISLHPQRIQKRTIPMVAFHASVSIVVLRGT